MRLIILLLILILTPQMISKALKIETDKIDICLNELYSCNR